MGLRVEMLAARTRELRVHRAPLFGAPKACSSWDQGAKICPRGLDSVHGLAFRAVGESENLDCCLEAPAGA